MRMLIFKHENTEECIDQAIMFVENDQDAEESARTVGEETDIQEPELVVDLLIPVSEEYEVREAINMDHIYYG